MRKDVFRKGMVLGMIFLFVGVGVVPSIVSETTSYETTIYVDDDAEPPYDGSIEHPYRYINDALDNSSDGYTIYVYNGNYNEFFDIKKAIILTGENKENTVLKNGCHIYEDGVTVTGFKIESLLGNSIVILSSNNMIYNNEITGTVLLEGIVSGVNTNNQITNNEIFGHLLLTYANENLIQDNEIFAFFGCMGLIDSHKNEILWNDLQGASGISLTGSNENNVECNNFRMGMISQATFLNSGGTNWEKNYWALWNYRWPKPIFGRVYPFFPLPFLRFPILNWDINPAEEPYEIPHC